jgi:Kae1-associated kinase Bud32
MKLISQGAEARLYRDGDRVLKQRIAKSYRLPVLDLQLRKQRTRSEAKLLQKAAGIAPKLLSVDEQTMTLTLEYLDGKLLKDVLDAFSSQERHNVLLLLGKHIARLHQQHIIHGDLTTSNILVCQHTPYLIDFGLGFISLKPEDKAVDLENEVLFVLICLEPPKDLVENIKRELGLDDGTSRRIADYINGSVFGPVMKDIKSVWENIEVPKENLEPPIKSYDSFEQAILRQAQAMKPAMPISSGTRDLELGTRNVGDVKSELVPNTNQNFNPAPKILANPPEPSVIPPLKPPVAPQIPPKHYAHNNDPYREPVE